MMHRLSPVAVLLVLAGWLSAGDAPRELPPVVYSPLERETPLDPAGQGVWLPYERFRQWWERAEPTAKPPAQPPLAAALTEASFTGQAEGARARFAIKLTAVAVAEGWSTVELPGDLPLARLVPADARVVVQRATSIGVVIKPGDTLIGIARERLGDADAWKKLLEANPGLDVKTLTVGRCIQVPLPEERVLIHLPGPGSYVLDGEVSVAITGEAGAPRSFDLALPVAGALRAELLIPGAEPAITLESPGAWSAKREGEATRVLVAPRGELLALAWQPAVAIAGDAVLTTVSALKVHVAPRSLRYDLAATVTVSRRPVERLRLTVPDGMQVLAIAGELVARWEPAAGGVDIVFSRPVDGEVAIEAQLERAIEIAAAGSRLDLPLPGIAGSSRSTGTLALIAHDGVRAGVAAAPGLSRVDPGELGVEAAAAFRFHAQPAPATLDLAVLAPELRAQSAMLLRLGAEESTVAATFAIDVRQAGTFTLVVEAAEGWDLLDTAGLAVDEIRPLPAEGGLRRFELQLRSRLLGSGSLTCRFRAPPGLGAAPFSLTPPRLAGVRAGRGVIAVAAPRAFALQASERNALAGLDPAEAARQPLLAELARELARDEETALAFTWQSTAAEAPRVRLAASPRPREIAATIEDRITVKDGQLLRTASVRGEVRYNPAASLVLVLPKSWDEAVTVRGAGLSERVRAAAPAEADLTAWELRFQPPLIGSFQLAIEATVPAPRLAPGQPVQIAVPALRLDGIGRLTYIAALARDGAIDLSATAPGLEPVAPADLPASIGQGAVAGFQGAQAAAIALTATRQDLLALADAGVSRATWLAVVGEDGVVRLRGRHAVISRGRAQIALALPEGVTLVEAAVDGRPARASRREDGAVVLPLPADGGEHRIALVAEGHVLGGAPGWLGTVAFALPRLAETAGAPPVPVARSEIEVFLPARWLVTGWGGDLAPERYLQGTQQDGEDGLSVPVTPSGVSRVAARVGDGGTLVVGVIHQRLHLVLLVLGAGAAFALLWWLARRAIPAVAAIGVLGAGSLLAVEAWSAIAGTILLGGLAGLAAAGCIASVRLLRARRAATRSLTSDPWLEQGGKAP